MKSPEGVTFLVTLHENDEMLHSACEQLAVSRRSSLVSVPGFLSLSAVRVSYRLFEGNSGLEMEQDCDSRVEL